MGRPTSYKPEYAELAFRYALLGMTNVEMAVSFDVSGATLANWGNEFPEFLDARARGRDEADGAVVASLYKRALGGDTQAATWSAGPLDDEGLPHVRVAVSPAGRTLDLCLRAKWPARGVPLPRGAPTAMATRHDIA